MRRFLCGLVVLGTLGILLFCGAAAEAEPISIMPLGDSLTAGYTVAGGYRTRLYTDLQNGEYAFTFVGSATDYPSSVLTAAGQTHHEGHPGHTITQIANNLDGNDRSTGNNGGSWFHRPAPPDIVLLLIGGNDIRQGANASTTAQRLDKLIGQIVADSPQSLLFVSNTIPFKDANLTRVVQAYNTQIEDTILPKYAALGASVRFVDQFDNFVDALGNVVHIGSDSLHPDQTGYDLMGDTWAAAIQQAAPIPEPTTLLLLGIGSLGVIVSHWRRTAGGCRALVATFFCGLMALVLLQGVTGQVKAQPTYSYTTFDVPGAPFPRNIFATGINDSGQIVGGYQDATEDHAFLLDQGIYTTINPPGSQFTIATGINASGQIVGGYDDVVDYVCVRD